MMSRGGGARPDDIELGFPGGGGAAGPLGPRGRPGRAEPAGPRPAPEEERAACASAATVHAVEPAGAGERGEAPPPYAFVLESPSPPVCRICMEPGMDGNLLLFLGCQVRSG